MTSSQDISQRRRELEKARRDHVKAVMRDYDTEHYKALRQLREECGASERGHAMHFTHVGPLGAPWFCCGQCGLSEVGT